MSSAAAACRKAIKDANAKWPSRNRADDGIMGDARHKKRKSDHNLGNAVDITHDPVAGCDGSIIAELALKDKRVTYVIWNRQIFNKDRAKEGWRPYDGENPHTKHCHISIDARSRDDVSPWPWSPDAAAKAQEPAKEAAQEPAKAPDASAAAAPTAPAPAGDANARAEPPLTKPVERDPFPGVELKRGARGVLVKRLQDRLRALQWDVPSVSEFGPKTEAAVRGVQRRHELQPTGIVDRQTWRAIFG